MPRSHPRRVPKVRLNARVSQKCDRATLMGMSGLGNSRIVVHADKKSAIAAG